MDCVPTPNNATPNNATPNNATPISVNAPAFTPSASFSKGWGDRVSGGFGGGGAFGSEPVKPNSMPNVDNSNIPAPSASSTATPALCQRCHSRPIHSIYSMGHCKSCFDRVDSFAVDHPSTLSTEKSNPKSSGRKCIDCGTTKGFIHAKKLTCKSCYEKARQAQSQHDALSNAHVGSVSSTRSHATPKAEKPKESSQIVHVGASQYNVDEIAMRMMNHQTQANVSEKVSYKINIRTGEMEMHNDATGPKEWVTERNNTLPQRGMLSFAAGIRELEQSNSTQYLGWK